MNLLAPSIPVSTFFVIKSVAFPIKFPAISPIIFCPNGFIKVFHSPPKNPPAFLATYFLGSGAKGISYFICRTLAIGIPLFLILFYKKKCFGLSAVH